MKAERKEQMPRGRRGEPGRDLSYPYTWSNRNAPVSALLANALPRPNLDDLVRLELRYGADALDAAFRRLVAEGSS